MAGAQDQLINGMAEAIAAHEPLPEVTQTLTLSEAYRLQHQVTARRSPDGSGGIKLGVTTAPAQKFFGLDHALIGSLYQDSRLESGAVLPFLEGRVLESEFAVMVNNNGEPQAIAPAIEVVYLNFSRQEDMTAANLVLCNLGADQIVVGEFQPWEAGLESLTSTLSCNGTVVNTADMSDALGGPASALAWAKLELQQRGYTLTDDTLIMMGACGKVIPASRGHYQADYGRMGSLEFTIE